MIKTTSFKMKIKMNKNQIILSNKVYKTNMNKFDNKIIHNKKIN